MTQQELDALKALANAATPGPWHGDGNGGRVKYSVYGANEALVLRVDHKNAESGFLGDNAENDEAFVLAVRAAVPALLAEVERLNGERSFLMAEIKKQDAEVERLRADNAQLQQQRHAAREDAYRLGVEEGLSLSRGISNERDALRAELADVLEIAIARGDSLGYESMDYCARLEQLRPDSEILAA